MPEFFYQQVIFLKNPFLSILTFQMITVNFNLFTSVPPAESVYSNHYNYAQQHNLTKYRGIHLKFRTIIILLFFSIFHYIQVTYIKHYLLLKREFLNRNHRL